MVNSRGPNHQAVSAQGDGSEKHARSVAIDSSARDANSSSSRPCEAIQWLTTDAASRWIAETRQQARSPSWVASMRKSLSAEQVHAVLEQTDLRVRAARKFSRAAEMYFTAKGLQQATDERVARYKAGHFFQATAADDSLADLCTGIGGDLLALAAKRPLFGVDLDATTAMCARANSRVYGCERTQVDVDDVERFAVASVAAWHVDPDRRPTGPRTTKVEFSQPPFETIERLRADNPNVGIKLAPASALPRAWSVDAQCDWIGIDRECRQLFARFGSLAPAPGQRQATVLDKDGQVAAQIVGVPSPLPSSATAMGNLICDPHACVVASGLQSELAMTHSLRPVSHQVAYLTGDAATQNAAMAVFEVVAVIPLDIKRVKAELRRLGWGRLEIKRRGCKDRPDLLPGKLGRKLRVPGDQCGTLFVTPFLGRIVAVLAHRRSRD